MWTALEFLVTCLSRQQPSQGMHPGAHVAIHLIIWMYSAVVVSFLAIFITENYSYYDYYGYYSYSSNQGTAYNGEIALEVFIAILMVLHFVLFVRACVETHRYNNMPRATTIYVPVAMAMNGASYGSPYGYYGQNQVQIPPEMARQLAASGHAPVAPPQTLLNGYYAPPGAVPGTNGPAASTQPSPAAMYGYYAPPAAGLNEPVIPARRSMRQTAPSGSNSISSAGPSTVSPAPERTSHSPPTAPSPVSA